MGVKTRLLKLFNLWLPPVLWAAIIFKFSAGSVPVASDIFWQDFAVKKFGHFSLFGILAVLIYRGLTGSGVEKKRAAVWAVILAFFYGATDEYHQMFTQGRAAQVRDIFIDGVGAGAFVFIIYHFLSVLPKEIRLFLLKLGLK
jgi:hypothetical protein